MKFLLNLLGMAVAGFLGYSLEPSLRQQLTGKAPSPVEVAATGKIMLQLADGSQVSLEDLTKDQLPEKIVVMSPVKVSDMASGMAMTIEAGSQLKLLRIDGANAVVTPGEGIGEGRVPVMNTNLLKLLSANPPSAAKTPMKSQAPVVPEKTQPPVAVNPPVQPMPVEPPALTPTPAPTTPGGESADPPVVSEPPPVPAPAPVPEPSPVAPTPAPDGTPAVSATSEADIVKAMKDSIQSGQIKEFKIDQVLQWKAAAEETAEGESYQTGTILYKAETFLGTKTIEAKAFIKAGKVARWIWPRSGMEIK